jgi:hypothetical protein
VKCCGAVVATRVDRDAELEHQCDRVSLAVLGRAHERGPFVGTETVEQGGIVVEPRFRIRAIAAHTC